VCRDQGRVKTYEWPGDETPLLQQLRALFASEADREAAAVRALVKGVPGVVSVILFGSEARGEARPGSDTDLLIVVEKNGRRVEAAIRGNALHLAKKERLALSWQIADLAELRQWEREENPLWRNILAEGIRLKGRSPQRLQRLWQHGRTG